MGQYYKPINLDKKERIIPSKFDSMLKLMETCYLGNTYINVFTHLLTNEWKGDRVVFCGDYAFGDPNGSSHNKLEALLKASKVETDPWKLETEDISKRFEVAERTKWTIDKGDVPDPGPYDTKIKTYRFIVNETKGTYYDRHENPVAWVNLCSDKKKDGVVRSVSVTRIEPLTLFLACGNGLGGGDYFGPNEELIGSYAGDMVYGTNERPDLKKVDCPFDESDCFIRDSDEAIESIYLNKTLDALKGKEWTYLEPKDIGERLKEATKTVA